jgi:uncharacterized membrane protein
MGEIDLWAYYTLFSRFWQTLTFQVLTREVFRDIVLSSLANQSAIFEAGVTKLERAERFTIFLDKLVLALAKHWLLLVNLVIAVYSGLPLLAPILMGLGYTWPAEIIHAIYKPHCHQLPQRSFFLFGPRLVYSLETLQELLGAEMLADDSLARTFIGNATLGYKMAFCQRDTAMYGSMLLAGMLFGLVRRRLRPLPFALYLVLLAPWAIDGLVQLLTSYESTWQLRTVTGSLFGLGTVWFAYPYLEAGAVDLRRTIGEKLRLE